MSFWDKLKHWFDDPCEVHGEPELREVLVRQGDSLWSIAKGATGDGMRWRELAAANPSRQWDEHYVIHPGDKLRIPASWCH